MPEVINIDSAPRDLAALTTLGRVALRRLAEQGGLIPDESAKMRFMNGTSAEMAQAVFTMLQMRDQKAAASGAVEEVDDQPEPAPHAVQRPPVNGGRTPATRQPVPAARETLKSAGPAELSAETMAAINRLSAAVEANTNTLQQLVGASNMAFLSVRGTNRLIVIQMALSLLLAEQVLNAGRGDVLNEAVNDTDSLIKMLEQLGVRLPKSGGGEDEGN